MCGKCGCENPWRGRGEKPAPRPTAEDDGIELDYTEYDLQGTEPTEEQLPLPFL